MTTARKELWSSSDRSDLPHKNLCGVYSILNKINGKRYIGSAARGIRQRWAVHVCYLNKGEHHSPHLQRAWKKDGKDAFVFEVLIECPPEDCLKIEQWFIDAFQTAKSAFGYNVLPTAGSALGCKRSLETRKKLADVHKGKKWKPGQHENFRRVRLAINAARKAAGIPYHTAGKKRSPEHVAAIQRGLTEARARRKAEGIPHWHTGRKYTPEQCRAVSEGKLKANAAKRAKT